MDPDALEVRIRVQRPGEQGRPHDGGDAAGPAAIETGERKLNSKLLEAFSLLCQAPDVWPEATCAPTARAGREAPTRGPPPISFGKVFQQPRQKSRMASNLGVVSMIADIGQQQ